MHCAWGEDRRLTLEQDGYTWRLLALFRSFSVAQPGLNRWRRSFIAPGAASRRQNAAPMPSAMQAPRPMDRYDYRRPWSRLPSARGEFSRAGEKSCTGDWKSRGAAAIIAHFLIRGASKRARSPRLAMSPPTQSRLRQSWDAPGWSTPGASSPSCAWKAMRSSRTYEDADVVVVNTCGFVDSARGRVPGSDRRASSPRTAGSSSPAAWAWKSTRSATCTPASWGHRPTTVRGGEVTGGARSGAAETRTPTRWSTWSRRKGVKADPAPLRLPEDFRRLATTVAASASSRPCAARWSSRPVGDVLKARPTPWSGAGVKGTPGDFPGHQRLRRRPEVPRPTSGTASRSHPHEGTPREALSSMGVWVSPALRLPVPPTSTT